MEWGFEELGPRGCALEERGGGMGGGAGPLGGRDGTTSVPGGRWEIEEVAGVWGFAGRVGGCGIWVRD